MDASGYTIWVVTVFDRLRASQSFRVKRQQSRNRLAVGRHHADSLD
jgi:hypothetical protein